MSPEKIDGTSEVSDPSERKQDRASNEGKGEVNTEPLQVSSFARLKGAANVALKALLLLPTAADTVHGQQPVSGKPLIVQKAPAPKETGNQAPPVTRRRLTGNELAAAPSVPMGEKSEQEPTDASVSTAISGLKTIFAEDMKQASGSGHKVTDVARKLMTIAGDEKEQPANRVAAVWTAVEFCMQQREFVQAFELLKEANNFRSTQESGISAASIAKMKKPLLAAVNATGNAELGMQIVEDIPVIAEGAEDTTLEEKMDSLQAAADIKAVKQFVQSQTPMPGVQPVTEAQRKIALAAMALSIVREAYDAGDMERAAGLLSKAQAIAMRAGNPESTKAIAGLAKLIDAKKTLDDPASTELKKKPAYRVMGEDALQRGDWMEAFHNYKLAGDPLGPLEFEGGDATVKYDHAEKVWAKAMTFGRSEPWKKDRLMQYSLDLMQQALNEGLDGLKAIAAKKKLESNGGLRTATTAKPTVNGAAAPQAVAENVEGKALVMAKPNGFVETGVVLNTKQSVVIDVIATATDNADHTIAIAGDSLVLRVYKGRWAFGVKGTAVSSLGTRQSGMPSAWSDEEVAVGKTVRIHGWYNAQTGEIGMHLDPDVKDGSTMKKQKRALKMEGGATGQPAPLTLLGKPGDTETAANTIQLKQCHVYVGGQTPGDSEEAPIDPEAEAKNAVLLLNDKNPLGQNQNSRATGQYIRVNGGSWR